MNNNKLVSTAKLLDTFVKVLGAIFKICAIICTVVFVLVLIFGNKFNDMAAVTFNLDFLTLTLSDNVEYSKPLLITRTVLGLVISGAACFLISYIAALLRKIIAPMKEGRPFEEHTSATLKKIAWISLITGAIIQIGSIAEQIVLLITYPVNDIFASPLISHLEFNFTFDLTFVLIFVCIMFLSYIFSYGQQLQKESDETL